MCRRGWGRSGGLVGLEVSEVLVWGFLGVFDHTTVSPRGAVFRGQSRLTAAFKRIQDLSDERRWTAACVDILEVAEERQKILVSRHISSSVLIVLLHTLRGGR